MTDTAGLQVLSPDESVALLTSVPVGRIAFTDRALPAIQPVNFVVDDGSIVFRTGAGSKLAAATREAIVAFQADSFDDDARAGWSVMAVGRASRVTDEAEVTRLSGLPLSPWVPTPRDHFVRIDIATISGRRIPRA
jgi:nitroimidazol reductase NimA-like FMN-containing flavoprotein (pyridoxamine 5'-phosphate oxidase superfamily)